jgi:hypothetical protein
MKGIAFAIVLFVPALVYAKTAEGVERTVVIPKDNASFTVNESDLVRLTGTGIAGAKIAAKVEGPAKIEAENIISERSKGKLLIGMGNKEFEIKPSGKGKVTVTITSTPPQPGAKPKVTKYEFEIK